VTLRRAAIATPALGFLLALAPATAEERTPPAASSEPARPAATCTSGEGGCPGTGAAARVGGTVHVNSGPNDCGGEECFQISVECPNLGQAEHAVLKIGAPSSRREYKGMVLFMTGLGGTGFWERFGSTASRTLSKLRASGYRTVQLKWERGWLYAAPGRREGQAALACRPATVAHWLLERYDAGPNAAFCASGSSAGASQIAYMMGDYGLADRLDAVVMTGGPPFARLDWGCLRGDPEHAAFSFSANQRRFIDGGFGYSRDVEGPCTRGDAAFVPEWQQASHLTDGGTLVFPRTSVWVLIGDRDDVGARPQAEAYVAALRAAGSPDVHQESIKRTPHDVPSTSRGAKRVRKLLQQECRPR